MDYTLIVYKQDKRYKAGEVLVGKYDYRDKDEKWMLEEVAELEHTTHPKPMFRIELHLTWVDRVNAMTGATFKERFDTPYSCSPSSEAFWQN